MEFLRKKVKAILGLREEDLSSKEAEFLPAAMEVVERPPSPMGRMILYVLFGLVLSTLAWAILGKVDEVAVATGRIIPVGQVKVIQPEDKGVVKNILVKEGQSVKQGQVLVELDETFTGADLAKTKKEIAYYQLEIERLTAEQDGGVFAPANPEYDPKDMEYQIKLFNSRTNEYKAKLLASQASMKQYEASLRSANVSFRKYSEQLSIAEDKERRYETLVQENSISALQLLEQRGKRMELAQSLAAQEAEIAKAEFSLAQGVENVEKTKAEWQKDITSKLVDDYKQLQAKLEDVSKAQEKKRLARIVSPVDGKVSQLAVFTVGGVVTAAQSLMTIVPEGTALEAEVWVANKDIGFINVGQTAEIKVETFNFQKYGTIEAEISEVSPDAKEDKEKGLLQYRVALRLKKDNVIVNDKFVPLSPGMTATAEIKIKEKSIIEFFLDPFKRYRSEALRER